MPDKTAERLKRKSDEIMKRWEARAYKEVAAARHQQSLALRDSLPEYLEQLVDALRGSIDRTTARAQWDRGESRRVGRKHGAERARSLNYTIDQLIFEYHILRQVVCEVMEEEAPLTSVEREAIVASIEQAVNDAATEFSDMLRDIQDQLTHKLAHDLRTPISVAKTGALLIIRRPDDVDHCVAVASRISANMDQLDLMIRDLLDVGRLKAGQKVPMHPERCDLDLLLRQVAEESNFLYGKRFALEHPARPVHGYWDQSAIRRVVTNLASNAAKYSVTGTRITFGLTSSDKTVTVSVHNQGKPIPSEDLAILFQQFRRARSAQENAGWGLGLAVVKGLVEAHGGSVSVVSEEGKGTTFTIELPIDSREALGVGASGQ